jgi:hypothetical protein
LFHDPDVIPYGFQINLTVIRPIHAVAFFYIRNFQAYYSAKKAKIKENQTNLSGFDMFMHRQHNGKRMAEAIRSCFPVKFFTAFPAGNGDMSDSPGNPQFLMAFRAGKVMVFSHVFHPIPPFRNAPAHPCRFLQEELVLTGPFRPVLAQHSDKAQNQQYIGYDGTNRPGPCDGADKCDDQRGNDHGKAQLVRSITSGHEMGNSRTQFIQKLHSEVLLLFKSRLPPEKVSLPAEHKTEKAPCQRLFARGQSRKLPQEQISKALQFPLCPVPLFRIPDFIRIMCIKTDQHRHP